MNGEKPLRERKKKMPYPSPVTEEPISIMSLPYDLLLNCFSLVSRLYYPTLSLVSKTFRSIITSRELYEIRSRLNRTDKCLYLCFPYDMNTHWFTLCREPNRNVAENSSGYLLVQVPSPNGLLPVHSSSVIAVGSNIYKIGGTKSYRHKLWKRTRYSSSVSVLDCRSHRWRQAPGMRVARGCSSTVCEVDGKIYVAGGCKEDIGSLYWIEVFDPKTQTWGTLKNPCIEYQHDIGYRCEVKSLGLDGKIYMFGSEFVVYNFEEDRWKCIGRDKYNLYHAVDPMSRINSSSCVVDNVLFILDKGTRVFKWYDFKVSLWKELNGVEGLPDLSDRGYVKMVDLGGKIAVLWQECLTNKKIKRIWCAEISLERRDRDEIWGKVEWFDIVLSVHSSFSLLCADAISVVV
ncbi:putative F-box/kelch-repeat protein [Arabidopsis thaliana]|uniref:F-box domain-containing protein n=1 Tax=Arabidopsis thaliana TaxID=3702 RepID=A0A5S9WSS2_ARATH|nr:unnamed protein product [Arabidopsis thaliana]